MCSWTILIIASIGLVVLLWKLGRLSFPDSLPVLEAESLAEAKSLADGRAFTTADIVSFVNARTAQYQAEIERRKGKWLVDAPYSAPEAPRAGLIGKRFRGKLFILRGRIMEIAPRGFGAISVTFAERDWPIMPAVVSFPDGWRKALRKLDRSDEIVIVARLVRFESAIHTYRSVDRHLVGNEDGGFEWRHKSRVESESGFDFRGKAAFLLKKS